LVRLLSKLRLLVLLVRRWRLLLWPVWLLLYGSSCCPNCACCRFRSHSRHRLLLLLLRNILLRDILLLLLLLVLLLVLLLLLLVLLLLLTLLLVLRLLYLLRIKESVLPAAAIISSRAVVVTFRHLLLLLLLLLLLARPRCTASVALVSEAIVEVCAGVAAPVMLLLVPALLVELTVGSSALIVVLEL
jgi:hypothetical protein